MLKELSSLDFLKPHLSDVAKYDSNSPNTLAAGFHSLIQSTLQLFVDVPLPIPKVVSFLQRLLETLPSSSDPMSTSHPRPKIMIGELLVDVYWSVETQLDERLVAIKSEEKTPAKEDKTDEQPPSGGL